MSSVIIEYNEAVKVSFSVFHFFCSLSDLEFLVIVYYSRVQEENEEKRESLVRLVQLDLPALKVPLEMMVLKAAQ